MRHIIAKAFALTCLLLVILVLTGFPIANVTLALCLGVYALVLLIFPHCWLLILPALLPVLDLTPWTGKELISEFDLFVLITASVAYGCDRFSFKFFSQSKKFSFLLILLVIVEIYSLVKGIGCFLSKEESAFIHYHTWQTSMRMTKGLLEALLLLPLLVYAFEVGKNPKRWLALGVLTGLSLCIIAILLERVFYAGLTDFGQDYRVSGMFSEMALGGAFLDAFLLLSLPFVFLLLRRDDNPTYLISGFTLVVLGLYCVLVTYTRTTYLAVAIIVALIVLFNIRSIRATLDKLGFYVILGGMVLAILLPVIGGDFLKQRFGTVSHDFSHRFDHWAEAADIMEDNVSDVIFGMGRGTFPYRYFDSTASGAVMSRFWLIKDKGEPYLRFSRSGADGTLFIKQRLMELKPGAYRLDITMRTHSESGEKLLVEFCERNILKAEPECPWLGLTIEAETANQWVTVSRAINFDQYLKGQFSNIKPIEISLMNRGLRDFLDIKSIELIAADGKQVLANPNFSEGFDRWMFSSGEHLAWHIKNMWVTAYFESGLLGLFVLALFLLATWIVLFNRALTGDAHAMVLVSGVSGLALLGLFASVFDDPRISLLFFLLSWLAFVETNGKIREVA